MLRNQLIRLAYNNPEIREDVLPLLVKKASPVESLKAQVEAVKKALRGFDKGKGADGKVELLQPYGSKVDKFRMTKKELQDHLKLKERQLRAVSKEQQGKKASLQDGPVGRVLDKYWNILHDFESELKGAVHEYDSAGSYRGGPGEGDAKKVMKGVQDLAKAIDRLASRDLEKVLKMEQAFMKKHGSPEDYVEQQQSEMFPR